MEQNTCEAAETKDRIRNKMRKLRRETSEKERLYWEQKLAEQILSLGSWEPGSCVYCYISVQSEAGTSVLIQELWDRNVAVAVPRVQGKDMDFYYITKKEDLEPGAMGIPEPVKSCRKAKKPDAPVLVPGVAFGQDFSRLGYGGGYYDRFFEREPEHLKIGICYEFQLEQELPSEPFDVKMDVIVTPDRYLAREERQHA
ncbi:MAG: 5-formyltetrahydrofolate cyclo-ligase [Clostridium sp.]|jgi:5-formyltetrahydrofolate cyclo-ligase|nr:5-formyltetrahydrofolate cyclo-ligase [Clostridium sp.]